MRIESIAVYWLSNRMADILETQPGPLQLTVDATPPVCQPQSIHPVYELT